MLLSYIKTAFRNLHKNKSFSFFNIGGLSIGIACFILIALFIQNELSFDSNHYNKKNIYRIVSERRSPEGSVFTTATPPPLGPSLSAEYSGIESSVRFLNMDNPAPMLAYNDKKFYEDKFFFADPEAFDVFTIPVINGNGENPIARPNSLAITERTADRYFGKEDPIGKTLTFNNYLQFEITAVVKDPPANSTIQFNFLASFSSLENWLGSGFVNDWQNYLCQTYILTRNEGGIKELYKFMPGFMAKHTDKNGSLKDIRLQPLSRIHLYSFEDLELVSGGDIKYVYLFAGIALFILAIACINFINMSAARVLKRSKEIGVRKVFGAYRRQLTSQFLVEIFLFTFISLIIALAMVELALPYFRTILGRDIVSNGLNVFIIPAGLVLLLSFAGNSYPAFIMSALKPIDMLKRSELKRRGNLSLRKALIIFQFSLTIILITNTWAVYKQLKFMESQSLGAGKEKVIIVPIRAQELRENPEALKERLKKISGVIEAGAAALYPGGPVGKARYKIEGSPLEGTMSLLWVDYDFNKTLNLDILEGRDFSRSYPSDLSEGFIINEEAARKLGWNNPADAIGKPFKIIGSKKGVITGVVKNFYFVSLRHKIEPMVMTMWNWLNYVLVRTDGAHLQHTLDEVSGAWSEFDPDNPFSYTFLDDDFNGSYKTEILYGGLSGFFTLVAVIISCIGLFSLSAFIAGQSAREFGVRKILGASAMSIAGIQLKKYFALILLSNIIAIPVSFWIISAWLKNFAYKMQPGIGMFAITGAAAISIAFAAVGYQVLKASYSNPIETLRHE